MTRSLAPGTRSDKSADRRRSPARIGELLCQLPALCAALSDEPLRSWRDSLPPAISAALGNPHGDLSRWLEVLQNLPAAHPSSIDLNAPAVRIGTTADCDAATRVELESQLRRLHPWRKGPFEVFGTLINTEWRSDWKWDRLKDHIADLEDRRVLDVGCGSGYHSLRMAGAGARLVLGIEPMLLYVAQFQALRHYLGNIPVFVVPLAIENLPPLHAAFDTVFSMGVLYHRREPIDHLRLLRSLLRAGGELVLESLVVDGGRDTVLIPAGRYARMRNVRAIPSCARLLAYLEEVGFTHGRVIDVCSTSTAEQRRTDWMRFDSFAEALDPCDPARTVEGHPAPRRAIVIATAP